MPLRIIIDGYNVIRQSPVLRSYDGQELARGRDKLIDMLASSRMLKLNPITVVFDGWDEGKATEQRSRERGIDVVYSRRGEKADEVIKRLVLQSKDELIVVTSDSEIARFCKGRRCEVIPSPSFEEKVALSWYADLKGCQESEQQMPARSTKTDGTVVTHIKE